MFRVRNVQRPKKSLPRKPQSPVSPHVARQLMLSTRILPANRDNVHYVKSLKPVSSARTIRTYTKLPTIRLNVKLPSGEYEWPPELQPAYAITIREERWRNLVNRFGPWAKHITKFLGTDGRTINKNLWRTKGRIGVQCPMRRGELGCYDSHMRLWKTVIDNGLDHALIMEDDAAITYGPVLAERLHVAMEIVKKYNVAYDILFIGHGRNSPKEEVAPGIVKVRTIHGMIAYLLSKTGAEKLMQHAIPMKVPVDVLPIQLAKAGRLTVLAVYPSLFGVVPVHSDTYNIK